MEQARDSKGRFAGGAEAQARNAGRHPVEPHAGAQSVGTHVATPKQERIALMKATDARFGKRNVFHG